MREGDVGPDRRPETVSRLAAELALALAVALRTACPDRMRFELLAVRQGPMCSYRQKSPDWMR